MSELTERGFLSLKSVKNSSSLDYASGVSRRLLFVVNVLSVSFIDVRSLLVPQVREGMESSVLLKLLNEGTTRSR